ncbi:MULTISPECIES: hypothetical protein [unclassified Streptomyces]|uniref:hypothetical protein n=1 Tax=unclassified Streptomyces TaxID=2593676 RepID=UPI00403D4C69
MDSASSFDACATASRTCGEGAVLAALLQPDVVVGADSGEQRDFLPAQSGHPASPVLGQTDVLGFESLAAGPEDITAQLIADAGFVPLYVGDITPGRAPAGGRLGSDACAGGAAR